MQRRWRNIVKGVVLFLFAIFLADKYWSGKLYYYIGPRFGWLAALAAGLFVAIAIFYNRAGPLCDDDLHNHQHDHERETPVWILIVVSAPLVLGTLVPARPLGASAVANQGVSMNVAAPSSNALTSLTIIPAQRNILDWVRAIGANSDPTALNGQSVDVVGFVYRDVRFAGEQFMVARFTVACCVADARAMGLVVQVSNARQFETGAWVRVKGAFKDGMLDNSPMPVVVADEIVPVEQPTQPYLYP
jgi:putative membrane protein